MSQIVVIPLTCKSVPNPRINFCTQKKGNNISDIIEIYFSVIYSFLLINIYNIVNELIKVIKITTMDVIVTLKIYISNIIQIYKTKSILYIYSKHT